MVTWSALVLTLWFCLTVRHVSCQGHYENVALNKRCQLSSHHSEFPNDGSFAVNNNTDGVVHTKPYTNCIYTSWGASTTPGEYNSWWEVNLGRRYPVYNITVWAAEGFVDLMGLCIITVDGKSCYEFPASTANWPRRMDINCAQGTVTGSVVRLEKNVKKSQFDTYTERMEATINMCEFQVWSGCSARYWGSGCDQACGECRDGASCDKVTGHCDSGCKNPGLQPPLCTQECPDKSFGLDCKETCSSNCKDVCDKITGSCTCKQGWKGPTCLEICAAGHYGEDCAEECGACIGDVPCHHVNGSCQQCKANYRMPLCKECKAGHYGPDCTDVCGACNNGAPCNDRDGSCDNCDGNFMTPLCKECNAGHYGPDCSDVCGACNNSAPCNGSNGSCDSCDGNYMMPLCKAMASICACDKAAVAPLGSVVAVLGVAVVVLVVVVVIQFRRIRDMQQLLQKAPVRPTDIQMEVSRTSTAYENTQVLDDAAIEVDLSNYDKLEVYENKKDITNVYTDLTFNKQ